MLPSLKREVVKTVGDGPCQDLTDEENTEEFNSILVSAVLESQYSIQETSPAFQKLLNYLAFSSLDHISMLSGNPKFQHYLHRLVSSEVKYFREDNVAKLSIHFPGAVAKFQGEQLPLSYSYSNLSSVHDIQLPKIPTNAEDIKAPLCDGPGLKENIDILYSYQPSLLPVTFRAPHVRLSDLSTAILSISDKMKVRSANCKRRGTPVNSARKSLRIVRRSKHSTEKEKQLLCPVLMKDINDCHYMTSKSGHSLFPQEKIPMKHQTSTLFLGGKSLHNAQDVIEAFASGKLQSLSECVYLNYTNTDKWYPYDLTVVPKTKVQSEHFIMTEFGITLVTPDEVASFQPFSDWLKEASLFTLLRHINFFRGFKTRKALKLWHQSVRHLRFKQLSVKVKKMAVRFMPTFADALFQLRKLNEELLSIPFHNLKPLGGYTLQALELDLLRAQAEAHRLLNKYFKYSGRIVCRVVATTHFNSHNLETKYHQLNAVSDFSISFQQDNRKILKRNFEEAIHRRDKLDCFVDLAERMAYSCLVQLTQHAIGSWKEILLCEDSILHQASSGFQIPITLPPVSTPDYFLLSSMVLDELGKWFALCFKTLGVQC